MKARKEYEMTQPTKTLPLIAFHVVQLRHDLSWSHFWWKTLLVKRKILCRLSK